MNACDDGVFILKLRALGRNQSQNDFFARCDKAQRLKTAGTRVIELQIIGIDIFMRKQALCDRLIAAPAGPGGIVVAAANVGCNGEIIRFALKREVVDLQKLIHDVAHLFRLHAEHKRRGGVYANAPRAVIKLQVAAACVVELLDERPIDLCNVLKQLFAVRVDFIRRLRVHREDHLLVELCRRRNGLLCDGVFVLKRLHKPEVLHKRVRTRQL